MAANTRAGDTAGNMDGLIFVGASFVVIGLVSWMLGAAIKLP